MNWEVTAVSKIFIIENLVAESFTNYYLKIPLGLKKLSYFWCYLLFIPPDWRVAYGGGMQKVVHRLSVSKLLLKTVTYCNLSEDRVK